MRGFRRQADTEQALPEDSKIALTKTVRSDLGNRLAPFSDTRVPVI